MTTTLCSSKTTMDDPIFEAFNLQASRWRDDPVLFAKSLFKFEATPQQAAIMRAFAKPGAKVAVKSGHGVGKSALMAILAIWHVSLFPDSKAAATAPSQHQLRDVLMSEVGKWINRAKPWLRDQLDYSKMRLALKGREVEQFLTARTAKPEQPDALQGLHARNMAFFIDEAFGVADTIFEVARGALSTPNSRVMLCGNPTVTSGYAYQAFHRNKHLWQTFTLSCEDSPLVSESYVSEMKSEYGEDSDVYRVRVAGEFPKAGINQLIPRELAEQATQVKLRSDQYNFAPVIIGVDPAWEGDDRTCIFKRQGLASEMLGEWRNIDNMTLGGMVAQFEDQHNADAVFIDTGWGAGVIDYLRSIRRNPIAVNFGGSSISAEYANKRTEMWCELRKWLEDGGHIPKNEDLLDDLSAPEYYFMANGKKILERKQDMKKRGLPSPDLGDALALTFAAPVFKRDAITGLRGVVENKQHFCVKKDYNPLED